MKKYWKNYYLHNDIKEHTSFAEWSLKYMKNKLYVLDLGCGDGRDSYFLARNFHKVVGVDFAIKPPDAQNAKFIMENLEDRIKRPCFYDVVYSRFFLHSIDYTEVVNLLVWTRSLFVAEFRSEGDKPILYPGHKRNFIDGNKFLGDLAKLNFNIIYFEKGRGLSQYKGEDPLVIRVVAQKHG